MNKKQKKCISPIHLKSDIETKTEICPNLYLDILTAQDKLNYFNLIPDENSVDNLYYSTTDPIEPDIFELTFRIGLKYKLIYTDTQFKNMLNTFRLIKTSNFGIKYIVGDINKVFHSLPCCLYIPELTFNISDIPKYKEIYKLLQENKDDQLLNFILERFELILGENIIPVDIKFQELITILEALFLPNDEYGLKRKLVGRMSYIFKKYFDMEIEDKIQNYYEIRCNLTHCGFNKLNFETTDNSYFVELLDITRKATLLYIEHKYLFTEEKLNSIKIIK